MKVINIIKKFIKKIFTIKNVNIYVYNYIPFGVLDKSVTLGHQGIGIVINKHAKIGKNVFIAQNVTIGNRRSNGKVVGEPVIEDNVKIYSTASIFGNVVIGHDSVIGGAVVTKSVPPYSLVVEYNKIYVNKYKSKNKIRKVNK